MSAYGNIDAQDIEYIQQATAVAAAAANSAPAELREEAYSIVLAAILQDWVANQGDELAPESAEDLANMVRAAADLASGYATAYPASTFRAVLTGLTQDWVVNWGTEE